MYQFENFIVLLYQHEVWVDGIHCNCRQSNKQNVNNYINYHIIRIKDMHIFYTEMDKRLIKDESKTFIIYIYNI